MRNNNILFLALISVLVLLACQDKKKAEDADSQSSENEQVMEPGIQPYVSIEQSFFGLTPEGDSVDIYTMKTENGMEMDVITYGGIITRWTAPDRSGNSQDITLGYDNLEQYVESNPYFGALIGRYGNRIANGRFSIDGKEYKLAQNDGKNHLHGGVKGFDKVVWDAEPMRSEGMASLTLTYTSPDGEEGYPGELKVKVVYTLFTDNSLLVEYEATTDKPTVVNLTQHAYFNLSGDFSQNILDHEVEILADAFLPVDATLIPTGELRAVEGTPFDFRTPKPIGQDIGAKNDQLTEGKGYDHCWVLGGDGMRKVASAYHPGSGRYLEIQSTEPAIQFYTGNFLDGTLPAKNGGTYGHRTGFCLETQHYPDSPNQPAFPSVRLNPGETYSTQTSFQFSVK
ncbi:MAG: aldose epimerase family protein [Bacteroidia bacterium]